MKKITFFLFFFLVFTTSSFAYDVEVAKANTEYVCSLTMYCGSIDVYQVYSINSSTSIISDIQDGSCEVTPTNTSEILKAVSDDTNYLHIEVNQAGDVEISNIVCVETEPDRTGFTFLMGLAGIICGSLIAYAILHAA